MSIDAENYRLPEAIRDTFLQKIVEARLPEVISAKQKLPAESIRMAIHRAPTVRSLKKRLQKRPGIIAEIKKASPSAGLLRPGLDASKIAAEYQGAGAAGISVVTEPAFFQGTLETVAQLRWESDLPLLRKDFIMDSYQILESRYAGADAVLLIAALLDPPALRELHRCAEDLGMDPLVEVHTEAELDCALAAGSTLIGVNNRDLKTLAVSLDVSERLAARIPAEVVAIAESGIRTAADIRRLKKSGYRGFLVGEPLMRAASPGAAMKEMLAGIGTI
ncbi:MAG: trpC [Acidobacteria bacterium]|nr:trpC [Acidobacteriota bacterium]